MSTDEILRQAGIVLAAGLASAPLAALLRLPIMLVLVAIGLAVGPHGLGWVEIPLDSPAAQLIFTFGVALILFHGGVGVSLRVIQRTAVSLAMLVIPGVVLSCVLVALVAGPLLGVSFTVALLIGAVLAPTDPAILIPLFERLHLRPKVSQTVIAESAFNDPTGTVLALALAASVVAGGDLDLVGVAGDFADELALGVVAGVLGGLLLAALLSDHRFGLWRNSPLAAILAIVAVDYISTDRLGGSSFLAAFIMGLIVGNLDLFRLRRAESHERLMQPGMDQITEIATMAVFITLGVNLPLDAMRDHLLPGLAVMAFFVFVARPLVVLACAMPDRRARWTGPEIVFLMWCRETGVVPAALAGLLLSRGVQGASVVAAMVALAIVVTLLAQATTAGPLARRLGLVDASPGEA